VDCGLAGGPLEGKTASAVQLNSLEMER
jgi:hypothetical protein